MKIWAHCLVYNEENYLWFAVESVIEHVDKVLLWDTGSTDNTNLIIKDLESKYKDKILYKQIGGVDKIHYPQIRQEMLDETKSDWVLILDGDEVWPESSIKNAVSLLGNKIEAVVVPFYNLVGDIYHHQDTSFGRYELMGRKGFLTIRFINTKIKGLHVKNPYGKEGYFDADNRPIQESAELKYVEAPFFHMTHLERSSKGQKINKIKYFIGQKISDNMQLPEVFFKDRPSFVKDPLKSRGIGYILRSLVNLPREKVSKFRK